MDGPRDRNRPWRPWGPRINWCVAFICWSFARVAADDVESYGLLRPLPRVDNDGAPLMLVASQLASMLDVAVVVPPPPRCICCRAAWRAAEAVDLALRPPFLPFLPCLVPATPGPGAVADDRSTWKLGACVMSSPLAKTWWSVTTPALALLASPTPPWVPPSPPRPPPSSSLALALVASRRAAALPPPATGEPFWPRSSHATTPAVDAMGRHEAVLRGHEPPIQRTTRPRTQCHARHAP